MPYADHQKQKEAQRDHYKKNKKRYSEAQKRRRHKRREWLNEYKSKLSCEECGESHPAILDFHHNNDNKGFGVSDAIHHKTIDHVMKEIEKCKVLCANCHRKLHWNKRQKEKAKCKIKVMFGNKRRGNLK